MKQETINKIKEGLSQDKSYREIAKELNVSTTTVGYYSNDENRKKRINQSLEYFKKLSPERKKQVYKARNKRINEYLKKRYHSDEKFRKERLEYAKMYYLNKKMFKFTSYN